MAIRISTVSLAVMLLCNAAFADDGGPTPAINWDLDEAISQIERQANDFKTAMATVAIHRFDADDELVESGAGTAYFRSDGRLRFSADEGKRVLILEKYTVNDYDVEAGKVDEYRLSNNKDLLVPFARLGFSSTGRDLKGDYLITILGEELIGDARTLVLELTPKRDATRESVRQVRLWIDQSSWMPKRQEFGSTADGSRLVMTYSSLARNLKLNPDLFKTRWPRGTQVVKH